MDTVATWFDALHRYSYPVDLACFRQSEKYAGWFCRRLDRGDRAQTIAFENCFKAHAHEAVEAWFEVVYWKMFSQGRRDRTTVNVIDHVKVRRASAIELCDACSAYLKDPTKGAFRRLQALLVGSGSIAIAATFPAFMCPDKFPMVDTNVAKWVSHVLHDPRWRYQRGTGLVAPPSYGRTRATSLTLSDWPFVEKWIQWCRSAAQELSRASGYHWRARDVEMAVFTAQRTGTWLSPPIRGD